MPALQNMECVDQGGRDARLAVQEFSLAQPNLDVVCIIDMVQRVLYQPSTQ